MTIESSAPPVSLETRNTPCLQSAITLKPNIRGPMDRCMNNASSFSGIFLNFFLTENNSTC